MAAGNMTVGINGFGRIGKLTLWHLVGRRCCEQIVVNLGRPAGSGSADLAHYLERDSTYGRLHTFLHGHRAAPVVRVIDARDAVLDVDGTRVRFLTQARDPAAIGWDRWGARLVVDTTGRFTDPTLPPDHPGGALRGHLAAGAERVIVSAPFKIADKAREMPQDAVTTVMGVNTNAYDHRRHRIVSNASCTTTCLAHMMLPLLRAWGPERILSASMATIHAVTGSQPVLDRPPKSGTGDLRKNRSILNNIILTTTGAAQALVQVLPEMQAIGFIAESVRVPTNAGSLIILVLNLQEEISGAPLDREQINAVYERSAAAGSAPWLHYSERQNVSADVIGHPQAAAIIEGHETHTRTAEVRIDLTKVPGLGEGVLASLPRRVIHVPVTQAVVYGWYDNEMGSYAHMLVERTLAVAQWL